MNMLKEISKKLTLFRSSEGEPPPVQMAAGSYDFIGIDVSMLYSTKPLRISQNPVKWDEFPDGRSLTLGPISFWFRTRADLKEFADRIQEVV